MMLLMSCECIDKDYKTGVCGIYEIDGEELVLLEHYWFTEPCGCEDLFDRFIQATPSADNRCIQCAHPYNICPPYNTCPE